MTCCVSHDSAKTVAVIEYVRWPKDAGDMELMKVNKLNIYHRSYQRVQSYC